MASSLDRPQLARLVTQAPEGDDWLHEMKYDDWTGRHRLPKSDRWLKEWR